MVGIRGKTLGTYETNGGSNYNYHVDADRFLVAAFNWVNGIAGAPFLPRGFKPRHVTGLSPTSGRRGMAVVPTVTADIWTGVATTFDIEATDGTIDTMTVINRIGERPGLP
jgi:hypothetical protein